MSFHLMWEAYDTYTIQQSIALQILEPIATGNIVRMKMKNPEQTPTTIQDLHKTLRVDTLSTMPTFMGGGLDMFREWFQSRFNLQIPDDLSQSGKIMIGFTVGKDGYVEDVEITYTDNDELAEIAANIVKRSPQWTPGMHNGEAVRVYYNLPIMIKIERRHMSSPSPR